MPILYYNSIGFEWDEAKSAVNKDKHGLSFEDALPLWDGRVLVVIGAVYVQEPRELIVGEYQGKHWVAVYTMREKRMRLISVRRARKEEVVHYEQALHLSGGV